ncbi:MAG: TonB-dependent receptor [Halioglobus sp.]|nr:TonB-dependent receptor [Halioglobus sp.]
MLTHNMPPVLCALLVGIFTGQVLAMGQLEEIIVTAEKRETTVQDTPIAVSAFTQEDLERALINNTMDIQMAVPNMLMSKGFFTTAQITIRGIGNLAVGPAADAGAGVHFNGVYLNAPRLFETEYFDTERVEVLRGPQGTLYGRNTTAGVVNVISKQAQEEFGGFFDASYGDYNYIRSRGAINFPVTDNLSQRFSIFYTSRDGFVDNVFDGDNIDDRNMYAIRSSTALRIGDSTEAHLTINYFDEDSHRMRGAQTYCARDPDGIIGCLPNRGRPIDQNANTAATVGASLINAVSEATGLDFPDLKTATSYKPNDLRKVSVDFTPQYETDETIGVLEIIRDWDDYTLNALTGYHKASLDARNDYDMTVNNQDLWPIFTTYQRGPDGSVTVNYLQQNDRATSDPEQWSQEFRLNTSFDGNLDFMAGAFYLRNESDVAYYVYSSALSLYGDYAGIPEDQWVFENLTRDYKLETWALFGETYWDITDQLQLTVGLRYSDESKKSEQRTVYLIFLNNPNGPNDGFTPFESDNDEVTGKINLNYHLTDEIMFYGTLARSYKGGGFNPISSESPLLNPAAGGNPDLADFDPEFINSIELGAKTRFLDNSVQANMSAFYYDYTDLQVSKIINQTSINENMDADVWGFEGEFLWAPTTNWNFLLNLSYLGSKLGDYKTFDPADINRQGNVVDITSGLDSNSVTSPDCPNGGPSCPGLPIQVKGNKLPNAPEFSVYTIVGYNWFLTNGMRATLSTTYYWQDKFYTRIFNTEDDLLNNWDVWNASAILNAADDTWYGELWIRNVLDDENWTGQYLQGQAVGLFRTLQLLEPRTFGLTVGYRF